MHHLNALNDFVYWSIGTSLVCGGIALLFIRWTRRNSRTQTRVFWAWLTSVVLLSYISFLGVQSIAQNVTDDIMTNGPTVMLLGIVLLANGGLVRMLTESGAPDSGKHHI